MKTCRKCRVCGDTLIVGGNWSNGKCRKRDYICNPCSNVKNKIWRDSKKDYIKQRYIKNKDKIFDSRLRYQFGIGSDEYYKMLNSQNNVCAICGKVCTTGRNLAVDHCHKTKDVRGLLCSNCNNGLGRFKDNIDILKSAIKYLRKAEKKIKNGH